MLAGPRGEPGRRLLLRRAFSPGRPRGRPVEAAARLLYARVAGVFIGVKRPCLVFAVLAFEARSTSFYAANLTVGDVVAGPAGQEKLPALAALGFRPVLGRTQFTNVPLGRGRGPVWKSRGELGFPEKYCADLRDPPRHRAEALTRTTSRRWRGDSTPSSSGAPEV